MVPSDLHFIIRHGLTGFMFIAFVLFGIWNVELWFHNGCSLMALLRLEPLAGCAVSIITLKLGEASWLVLILCVIIGITLQGGQMLLWYRRKRFFTDPARLAVARQVVSSMASYATEKPGLDRSSLYQEILEAAARDFPDSLYVWVYHSQANTQLIEWARRRRSYHYLGLHFATSFLFGVPIGLFIGMIRNYPLNLYYPVGPGELFIQALIQVILFLVVVAWVAAAFYLSGPMKTEADYMELAWSLGQLHPDYRNKIFGEMPKQSRID